MTGPGLKERLEHMHQVYLLARREYRERIQELKGGFKLSVEQQRELDFGIIIPADRSLQEYADVLNSDELLLKLHERFVKTILVGSVEIVLEFLDRNLDFPGYPLEAFVKDPVGNQSEIVELMQGLGGCKHIRKAGGKLTLEIPAREFLPKKDAELLGAIDFWLEAVEELTSVD